MLVYADHERPIMNEAWINMGWANNAVRLDLKKVQGSSGLGVMQLRFHVEASCRDEVAAQKPLLLEGRLYAEGLGSTSGYVRRLAVEDSPVTLHSLAATTSFVLVADVDHRQLQVIEEHRTGGMKFRLQLTGTTMNDGSLERIGVGSIECELTQNDWAAVLDQMQYRRLLLIELDAPDANRSAEFKVALEFYRDAEKQYLKQEWRLTVEALRQSLAALVGKTADEEDEAADVEAAFKTLRREANKIKVGYPPRAEQVRRALKFMCDLGAHPETAETVKANAYSALLMTGGLLHEWQN
ncbi:hypothetical protein [Streptomyces griseoflavus]|uniref:hypothetical protein n=1 Tax=Streptomyces griseoflavus TaxID=35619 RepID=UPI0033DBA583